MFELRVLNGLHQGAALPLVGEQWLIGADADHDLALYDPGIAALHCRLSRTGEGWTLDAEDSLINDDEGHALTATVLVPTQTFALGHVWLCLAPAEEAWAQVPMVLTGTPQQPHETENSPPPLVAAPAPRLPRFKLACGVLVGLVVGAAATYEWMGRNALALPQAAVANQGLSADSVVAAPAPVTAIRSDKISLVDREAIRRRLATLLSDRLLTQVSIEDSGDGLVLKGNLQDEALLVYQRMLETFNQRYAPAVPVLDQVATAGSGLPFVIAQIISGTNAHVVTADGHRMYIGDRFNGLRLTRIDDQRIEFDGDQHIEVHW